MKLFKNIDRELDKNPYAVLVFYSIIFLALQYFLPEYYLSLVGAIILYEVSRRMRFASKLD